MLSKRWLPTLAAALLAAAGSSYGVPAMAAPGGGGGGGLVPLSADEETGLLFMREEEKLARDSYITLGGLWGLPVFANISGSEQTHMDAVKTMLDKYGVPDPVAIEPNVGRYVDQELQDLYDDLMDLGDESAMAALFVGGAIEETDMVDIQHWIDLSGHDDVIGVYESLLCGSRNHLRAFVGQIENRGEVYVALGPDNGGLTQKEVDAIVADPVESDCGGGGGGGGGGNRWGGGR